MVAAIAMNRAFISGSARRPWRQRHELRAPVLRVVDEFDEHRQFLPGATHHLQIDTLVVNGRE
jgi:hypothetical protein